MIRILFCTNCYDTVTNGPAKFAKNLLKYSQKLNNVDFFILSEDIKHSESKTFKINVSLPKWLKYFSQFFRMIKYMSEAQKLDSIYSFDLIIYNNALIGSIHSLFSKKIIGMVNDENNIIKAFKNNKIYLPTRYFIFQIFERIAVKNMAYIIVNSLYLKKILNENYGIFKTFVLLKGIEDELVKNFNFNILTQKEKNLSLLLKLILLEVVYLL